MGQAISKCFSPRRSTTPAIDAANGNTEETAVSTQEDNQRNSEVRVIINISSERSQLDSNSVILNPSSSQHVESGTSSSGVSADPAPISWFRRRISHNQGPRQPVPIMNGSTENHSEQLTNTDQENQDVLHLSNQAISNSSHRSNLCNFGKDGRTGATDKNKSVKRLAYLTPLNEQENERTSDVEDCTMKSLNNDNEEEPKFCSVCLDSCRDILRKGADIVTLGCKHRFCYMCFDNFKSSKKCPTCRARILIYKRRRFLIVKLA